MENGMIMDLLPPLGVVILTIIAILIYITYGVSNEAALYAFYATFLAAAALMYVLWRQAGSWPRENQPAVQAEAPKRKPPRMRRRKAAHQ